MPARSAYYLLMKREGFTAAGAPLPAKDSALALLNARCWPLWSRTRNRLVIKAGDRVAVYLSGDKLGYVFASARVTAVVPWQRSFEQSYPLMLDGTPWSMLQLDDVRQFTRPVLVSAIRHRLSFINQATKKWGVAMMGGCRALSGADFRMLTR